jgi:putative DeoR family transcriptional regulator (stage III sporulation protein D)
MIKFGCERRCEVLGEYIAVHGATVRDAARIFGISKSTVHKDVTNELPQINPELGERVRAILEINKSERHLRGGEATRKKYCRQIKKNGA